MTKRRSAQLWLEELESRLAPSITLSTLASFNDTNGRQPLAGPILDSRSGNLYGTTAYGGTSNDGTVFEMAAGSNTITTLASFSGISNGAASGLILDSSSRNLYGTTSDGGSGDGTVFELAAGSHTITTLASFNGSNGAHPGAGLIMDSSGNFYGTTDGGGSNSDGTVFELAAGSDTITALGSFNSINGRHPQAGLIMDSSSDLYGTTDNGGLSGFGAGTVFEIAAGSHTIATLASFQGSKGLYGLGAVPGGLVRDNSGNLYGTTSNGGDFEAGTVFKVSARSPTLNVTSSPNPSVFGQAVTITAAVSGGTGNPIPAGTADFKDGATDLTPGGITLSNGQATFSITGLPVGKDTITASYSGDSNYWARSCDDSQVVNQAGRNTALISSLDPSAFGQTVMFTATLSAAALGIGTPTGTIDFA